MRLNELVRTLLPEAGTVLDRTGADHAWPPSMKVSDGAPAPAAKDLLIVTTVADNALADDVRATFDGTAAGEGHLLLLPWPTPELPVGVVVQGLVSAGMQVVEAHLLADTAWRVALVCQRVDDEVTPLSPYLDRRRTAEPLAGRTLLRLVDEHVVEGLVWRTQELRAKETSAALIDALAERDAARHEGDTVRQDRATVQQERDAARESLATVSAARTAAEHDRDQARAERDRLAKQLEAATTRAESAERRARGIVDSRSYRVARSAARAARAPGRWIGKKQG